MTVAPTRRRIAVSLSSALVFLFTLEVAARVEDWVRYDAPLLGSYGFDYLFRATPEGVRGVPHGRYLRWSLNSLGLHGPEVRPDSGQRRVVVYGASECFGIYEQEGHEFPRVLERGLERVGGQGSFEVINAGIPGMRVGSGTSLLRALGRDLHPRAVVIYLTPTHYIGVHAPYCGRPPKAPAAPETWAPEPRIAGKVSDTVKKVLPSWTMQALRSVLIAWHVRSGGVLDRVEDASVAAMEVDLRCAVRVAREAGMVPILVTHANRFGPVAGPDDGPWLTGWRGQYPVLREGGFVDLENRANERVRAVAAETGTVLFDAAVTLGGHGSWFADHAHFNDEGAARMGNLLVPFVLMAVTPVSM